VERLGKPNDEPAGSAAVPKLDYQIDCFCGSTNAWGS
jgi:hypothetical protein